MCGFIKAHIVLLSQLPFLITTNFGGLPKRLINSGKSASLEINITLPCCFA